MYSRYSLEQEVKEEGKKTKSLRTGKEEINLSVFPDDRIVLYIKYKGIRIVLYIKYKGI